MISKYPPFLRFVDKDQGNTRGEGREDRGGLGCFSAPKEPSGVWTFRELFRARVRRDALLTAACKPGRLAYERG